MAGRGGPDYGISKNKDNSSARCGNMVFRDMMEACLESGVCDSFSTWGINDPTPSGNNPAGAPLMFDAGFIPKPAYFAVRDALLRNPADW